MADPLKLNLGCGDRRMPGYLGVDISAMSEATELVMDLDEFPWPFDDDSVARIEAKDVFEHVNDAVGFMVECHRILKPTAVLHIRTPHFTNMDAFTDPTHRRFPTQYTFDYWIKGTVLYQHHNRAYGGVTFDKLFINLDETRTLDVTLAKPAE
jgi:predicted SAM-dependent methyltransferase